MALDNSDLVKDMVELVGGGAFGAAIRDIIGWWRGRGKIAAEAEATITDAHTRQFEALARSYSDRVSDLTSEVHKLRDEVISLRTAYDQQQHNHAEQMSALTLAHSEQRAALREELDEAREARRIGT